MRERHCNADDKDKYDYDDGSDDYAFTTFLTSICIAVHINLLENSGTLPLLGTTQERMNLFRVRRGQE